MPERNATPEEYAAAQALIAAQLGDDGDAVLDEVRQAQITMAPPSAEGEALHAATIVIIRLSRKIAEAEEPIRCLLLDMEFRLNAAVELLDQVDGLIGESRGLDGYHLNGDVAEWGEFDLVSRIQSFLEEQ